jgi:hypothetical protein
MARSLIAVLALGALAGCSSLGLDPKLLENRIVKTLACDEVHVVSKYGPVGITSKIASADAAVLCPPPAAPAAPAAAAPPQTLVK